MLLEVVTEQFQAVVALRYPLERVPDEWEIPEVPVPESVPHDVLVEYLKALLVAWAAHADSSILVARNLAVRWVEQRPAVGIDPDVAVIEPAPPDWRQLSSLKLWEPGCHAPRLAVEVVSHGHPYKDYSVLPERYAAMGVGELWVLDPGRFGPRRLGGPHLIQQWTRDDDGTFVRRYAGEGPVHSSAVDAWVRSDPERGVALSSDAGGNQRWLTQADQSDLARDTAEAQRVAEAQRRTELEAQNERLAEKLRALGVDPEA